MLCTCVIGNTSLNEGRLLFLQKGKCVFRENAKVKEYLTVPVSALEMRAWYRYGSSLRACANMSRVP